MVVLVKKRKVLIKWSQAQLVIAKMSQLGVDETDQGETRLLLNLNISYSRQPFFCPILPKPVKNALKFKNIIPHFGITLFFNSVRQQYSQGCGAGAGRSRNFWLEPELELEPVY